MIKTETNCMTKLHLLSLDNDQNGNLKQQKDYFSRRYFGTQRKWRKKNKREIALPCSCLEIQKHRQKL